MSLIVPAMKRSIIILPQSEESHLIRLYSGRSPNLQRGNKRQSLLVGFERAIPLQDMLKSYDENDIS
ncbi:MAG: hypothetical protein KME23_12995 [Goleter apudmare HA4340-LM2]|nr:hypothetical protein [Goleter apudmare HA4340-LM2]